MSCFSPLSAWKSKFVVPSSGKAKIIFSKPNNSNFEYLRLPCGQCRGCRLDYSRQWAIRCYHESTLHKFNCFITLTFDDFFLDKSGSLDKRDFVLFMKRLRKRFCSKKSVPYFPFIRFFHCGEYGERFQRPHHHACLFGFDFPDKVLWRVTSGGNLYRSAILEELWSDPRTKQSYGFSSIGDVTFESAAYVARYISKKITGEDADFHYDGREPEYVTMSRGGRGKGLGGIGRDWLEEFGSGIYPRDFIYLRGGIKVKPPKYYDRRFELTDPKVIDSVRRCRKEQANLSPDNSFERLNQRAAVQEAKCQQLKRSYEDYG